VFRHVDEIAAGSCRCHLAALWLEDGLGIDSVPPQLVAMVTVTTQPVESQIVK
jgi:hypothetical protein